MVFSCRKSNKKDQIAVIFSFLDVEMISVRNDSDIQISSKRVKSRCSIWWGNLIEIKLKHDIYQTLLRESGEVTEDAPWERVASALACKLRQRSRWTAASPWARCTSASKLSTWMEWYEWKPIKPLSFNFPLVSSFLQILYTYKILC